MEEAPENGKESSHSAHANGINVWMDEVFINSLNKMKLCIRIKLYSTYISGNYLFLTLWLNLDWQVFLCVATMKKHFCTWTNFALWVYAFSSCIVLSKHIQHHMLDSVAGQ